MAEWFNSKDKRGYIGAWAFVLLVFTIIGFLAFKEIPKSNKDLITAIVGMLVTSLGVVVYTLIGKDESEVEELKKENSVLKSENNNLRERVNHLEIMFMDLQQKVISNLSLLSENSVAKSSDKK